MELDGFLGTSSVHTGDGDLGGLRVGDRVPTGLESGARRVQLLNALLDAAARR